MGALTSIIGGAKERIPNAFKQKLSSNVSIPPYPEGEGSYEPQALNPVVDADWAEIDRNIEKYIEEKYIEENLFDIDGKTEKKIRSRALKAIEEKGIEALGWYCSFHKYDESTWGIYLHSENIAGIALEMAANLPGSDKKQVHSLYFQACLGFILKMVYWHEFFHFKVDFFSLNMELLGSPCYLKYHENVYKKTKYTKEWNEEIFANNIAYEKIKTVIRKHNAIEKLVDLVHPRDPLALIGSGLLPDITKPVSGPFCEKRKEAKAIVEELIKESGYATVRRVLKGRVSIESSDYFSDEIKKIMDTSPAGYRDWRLGYDEKLKNIFCNQVLYSVEKPSSSSLKPLEDMLFKADEYYENYLDEVPLFTYQHSTLSEVMFKIPNPRKIKRALNRLGYKFLGQSGGHAKYNLSGKPNKKKLKKCLDLKDEDALETALSKRREPIILSNITNQRGTFLNKVVGPTGVTKEQFRCLT